MSWWMACAVGWQLAAPFCTERVPHPEQVWPAHASGDEPMPWLAILFFEKHLDHRAEVDAEGLLGLERGDAVA